MSTESLLDRLHATPRAYLTRQQRAVASVAVVVVVAAVARLGGVTIPLWWDERVAVTLLLEYGPLELITAIPRTQPHFPTWYVVADVWGTATGNVVTARLLSYFSGVLTVAGVYYLGRAQYGHRRGLYAAALVALAPPLIVQSGWLRMYAPLTLAVLLSIIALRGAVRRPSRSRWASWALATALVIALHPYGLLVAVSQGLLLAAWRRRPPWPAVGAVAATGAVATGLLVVKLTTRGGRPAQLKHLPTPPGPEALLAPGAVLTGRIAALWVGVTAAVLAAFVVAGFWLRFDAGNQLLAVCVVGPVVGAVVVSWLLSPIFQLKYLTLIAPPAALLAVDGCWRVFGRSQTQLLVGIVVLVQAATLVEYGWGPWIALRVLGL